MMRRVWWVVATMAAMVALASCGPVEFTPEIPTAFPGVTPPPDILPLSGSEIAYEPALWNDGGLIQTSTNCYAYMLNRREGFPPGHKLQPGELSGNPLASLADVTVSRIIELSTADAQAEGYTFYPVTREAACSAGSYKVALVVAPFQDYHWYRQNPDGSWSHKPGHTAVTDRDASGLPIWDPATANRDYGSINYTDFGGYFCVAQ